MLYAKTLMLLINDNNNVGGIAKRSVLLYGILTHPS